MFHRLHYQLALFYTFVTGCIFTVLTLLCLIFAENSLKAEDNAAFLRQLNSALIHLQEQDTISHQWLNQIQESGQFQLYLYDNGNPLYYEHYHESEQEEFLKKEALTAAATEHQMDIFSVKPSQVIAHTEFDFASSDGENYYASAGVIPKKARHLGFLILTPLKQQEKRIWFLRLVIFLTDLAAVSLILVFSWVFTKRLITPLEKNREKQMRFIASASHELRAPLAVLRSGLEVLQKTTDPAEQSHFIDLMTEESGHMHNLIRDMLLLANSDSGHLPLHLSRCQPDELLLGIYEKFEPMAAKRAVQLSIKLPDCLPDPPCLICDRERIIQVFSILLDNALSYTPSGGRIRLTLKTTSSSLLFGVSDTGCGVPDAEKELIFDRFYRSDHAHTERAHFGLGLCIAKEIIEAHQGSIWIEDAAGGGSCFFVKLQNIRIQNKRLQKEQEMSIY